jgi:hypothetical protein
VNDIRGAHSIQLLVDYFYIWDLMEGVILTQDVPDQVRWKLTQSGVYSNKSALCSLNGQNHKVCSVEKDLEKLGSSSLQVLHLVSYQLYTPVLRKHLALQIISMMHQLHS